MKILVFSDSHGSIGNMYDAALLHMPDTVVHLGDHISDANDLSYALPDVEVLRVPGNCDYASIQQPSILTELGGVRMFLTHGHLFGVKQGTQRLLAQAKTLGAQIALFGHTHRPLCEQCGGVWLLNPGTCGRFGSASYGVIEIAPGGSFTCRIEDFD